jgi:hypothetical protein
MSEISQDIENVDIAYKRYAIAFLFHKINTAYLARLQQHKNETFVIMLLYDDATQRGTTVSDDTRWSAFCMISIADFAEHYDQKSTERHHSTFEMLNLAAQ